MVDKEILENYKALLLHDAKEVFPHAVSVKILITAHDVIVEPSYAEDAVSLRDGSDET